MKSTPNLLNTALLPKIIVRTTMKVALACLLVGYLSGCAGHMSMDRMKMSVKTFFKSDLNAFLDGDGEKKPGIAESGLGNDVLVDTSNEDKSGDRTLVAETKKRAERCSADVDPKFSYRRRVALLAFNIKNRQDSSDFPHIETQYPELLHEFIDQDRFITTTATQYRLLNKADARRGAWVDSKRLQIMTLAKELGVQFVVTGTAEDMSVVDPRIDAFQLLMNKAAREKIKGEVVRHLEMSLNVYDGGTGRLIKRQTFADTAVVDPQDLGKRKLLNKTFLKSQYGRSMARILQQQSDFLLPALDCIPMQMKVLAVKDNGVILNAGIESLILPGDKLQLFRRVYMNWEGAPDDFYRLERYGALTVASAHTFSAEANFDQANMASGVNPGDIVQAW